MRRLQSVRSSLFFAAFLPNIQIVGGEIVKNFSSLGQLLPSTPSAAQTLRAVHARPEFQRCLTRKSRRRSRHRAQAYRYGPSFKRVSKLAQAYSASTFFIFFIAATSIWRMRSALTP